MSLTVTDSEGTMSLILSNFPYHVTLWPSRTTGLGTAGSGTTDKWSCWLCRGSWRRRLALPWLFQQKETLSVHFSLNFQISISLSTVEANSQDLCRQIGGTSWTVVTRSSTRNGIGGAPGRLIYQLEGNRSVSAVCVCVSTPVPQGFLLVELFLTPAGGHRRPTELWTKLSTVSIGYPGRSRGRTCHIF